MKVLVTGGSSLIGRVTVAGLLARGDEVTVFQRRPLGEGAGLISAASTAAAGQILGDIRDAHSLGGAVEGHDAVIHLAARVGVTGSWSDFESVNVAGTQNLIEGARTAGVGRFVHVSSPSVAHSGTALVGAPAGVADPTKTRGHYATSKAMAEVLALAGSHSAATSAMAVVAIRPHLVWGPGDEQLVGRIVERARSGRLAMVGSGGALVDSTYVDNAAAALIAALDRAPELAGQAFVVSNAQPRTVNELFARILGAAGLELPSRHVPVALATAGGLVAERIWDKTERQDDPPMTSFLAEQLSTAHWFDQRATQDALGWVPKVDLEQGFTRLAAWFDHEKQCGLRSRQGPQG